VQTVLIVVDKLRKQDAVNKAGVRGDPPPPPEVLVGVFFLLLAEPELRIVEQLRVRDLVD
jgi:hypothetical protein